MMIRTVISLDQQEKAWLDSVAKTNHISMASVIRLAIKEYRKKNKMMAMTDINTLLNQTKGTWPEKDGLKYQIKIRNEWRTK